VIGRYRVEGGDKSYPGKVEDGESLGEELSLLEEKEDSNKEWRIERKPGDLYVFSPQAGKSLENLAS